MLQERSLLGGFRVQGEERELESTDWDQAFYALGKLSEGIHTLAIGEGDVRSRLLQASNCFFRVTPSMLPLAGDVRAKVSRAHTLLTKYSPPEWNDNLPECSRDTALTWTLRRIQNRTGAKAASELFSAWLELQAMWEQHRRDLEQHAVNRANTRINDDF